MSKPLLLRTLAREGHPLARAEAQRATIDHVPGVAAFAERVRSTGHTALRRGVLRVMQINVGKLCNQTCKHCHVDAGPDRREVMTWATMEACLRALDACPTITTLDITGGAPEMNPHFQALVRAARARGKHVIDRCNLTILAAPGYAGLADFFAEQRVEIVASLPSVLADRTDAQRGDGVFEKSIAAMRLLNERGYGRSSGGNPGDLRLNLVYNPTGAFLPGNQASLEADYRRTLRERHAVEFDRLYTITNLPISRFLEYLERSGNLQEYMRQLHAAFNPATLDGLMCRETLSVGWDGRLFDCDFNQMLELAVDGALPRHIDQFVDGAFAEAAIVTGQHCYGCTAGSGSSCGGALL
ncbi:MAG: arsenosugar biosynthesis radical SAM protein ArsS [Phycisphaerae bacterium]|nr:arsenosugar biosynthesis radical SAM protein ArsS [Phycisphaerae bacterium]